jgi:hypothetical protein
MWSGLGLACNGWWEIAGGGEEVVGESRARVGYGKDQPVLRLSGRASEIGGALWVYSDVVRCPAWRDEQGDKRDWR